MRAQPALLLQPCDLVDPGDVCKYNDVLAGVSQPTLVVSSLGCDGIWSKKKKD